MRDSLAFLVSFAKYMATQMSKNEFEHYPSTNKNIISTSKYRGKKLNVLKLILIIEWEEGHTFLISEIEAKVKCLLSLFTNLSISNIRALKLLRSLSTDKPH